MDARPRPNRRLSAAWDASRLLISMHPAKETSLFHDGNGSSPEAGLGRGYMKADLDEVSDAPVFASEKMAKAKPFAKAFPHSQRAQGVRDRQKAPTKQHISLRRDRVRLETEPQLRRAVAPPFWLTGFSIVSAVAAGACAIN